VENIRIKILLFVSISIDRTFVWSFVRFQFQRMYIFFSFLRNIEEGLSSKTHKIFYQCKWTNKNRIVCFNNLIIVCRNYLFILHLCLLLIKTSHIIVHIVLVRNLATRKFKTSTSRSILNSKRRKQILNVTSSISSLL